MSALATKIADQIKADAERFHHGPRLTVKECEMAAEVQRLDAENAGLRVALEAVKDGSGLAKDLQAVRVACAARIQAAVEDAKTYVQLLNRLTDLVTSMRGQG